MACLSLTLGFLLIFSCLLLTFRSSESAAFDVGDGDGWTYNVVNWPNGKSFKAGDVLEFNYSPEEHNVVVVDADGYKNCVQGPNSKVYDSGNDKIALNKGDNYFICGIPGHCEGDMKIAVKAT